MLRREKRRRAESSSRKRNGRTTIPVVHQALVT